MFKPGDFCLVDSRKTRKGVSPKLEPNWVGPFEVLTAYPNKTYRLKDYEDVVNESRLKLYHAVNATALENTDDRQGISGFEPDVLSVENNCCKDIIRSDGEQSNASDDQQTFLTEKRKKIKHKQLVIKNNGRVGDKSRLMKASSLSRKIDVLVDRRILKS